MTILITVAIGDDLARVAELYATVGYGGVSIEDTTLIAIQGHRLIGAVRLCSEEDVKVLRGMHVLPEFQRQGVGKKLLSSCTSYLDGSLAYCLPYTHLVPFYEQIHFQVAERHELPPWLSKRLDGYRASGQQVLAMKRAAL